MSERARILLVDDRPENLLALEAILSSLDQTLVRANSGEDALRALMKDDFALILLDAQMPGMDGFETAARIKRRQRTKDVPIVFLTAVDKDHHLAYRGYAAGGADYLTKPFDPWVLRAKVQVFVDLWRSGRQLEAQAEMLRRQLAGHPATHGAAAAIGQVDVLGELQDRLADLDEAVSQLRADLAEAAAGPAVDDGVERLDRRLQALRRALSTLEPGDDRGA